MPTLPRLRTPGGSSFPEQPADADQAASTSIEQPHGSDPHRWMAGKYASAPDAAFKSLVVLCAVAVLAIVGLILFELVTQSHLSLNKFAALHLRDDRFLAGGPGLGCAPFAWYGLVPHGDLPAVDSRNSVATGGTAGGDPQRYLRPLGHLCSGAVPAPSHSAVFGRVSGLDRFVYRAKIWRRYAGGGRNSGHHDPAHHCLDHSGKRRWPWGLQPGKRCACPCCATRAEESPGR